MNSNINQQDYVEELANAIFSWQRGNVNVTVEFPEGTVDYENFMCFLSGADMDVSDLTDEQVEEFAADYVQLFSVDLF